MTKVEAANLVDYMEKLWSKWKPTDEQRDIWVDTFLSQGEPEAVKEALKDAYAKGRYLTPRIGDYREALDVLAGVRDPGVHAGKPPEVSPLFILECEVTGARKARDCKPRTSTWAYPQGLPADEANMQQFARSKLTEMQRMFPKAEWIIADARQPGVGASEYVKMLSWRLLNKERPADAPEAGNEESIPF